jgi:hypothetical protein
MIVIISPELVAAMVALSPVLTGSSDVPFYCDMSWSGGDNIVLTADQINKLEIGDEGGCYNGTFRPHGTFTSVVQEVGYGSPLK